MLVAQPVAFVLTHRSDADRARYSASFQALALARSLGRRGVPVVRLHPGANELSLHSRYCSAALDCPNVHESEPALLEFLLDLARRYEGPRVLFPASDDTADFLGRYREALCDAYRVVGPSAATIETIVDKSRQYAAAQAVGIPIPETHFPCDLDAVEALARELRGYPYIIKPNVAHRWRLASVKRRLRSSAGTPSKAVLVHDADSLVAEYRQISVTDAHVMVQRVIAGEDERLFCFYGYLDERSRALGYCVRRKRRQLPPRFGYSTLLESCENDIVVQQSLHLLASMRFHGLAGVEWKHDPESGEYKLIEINPRATNAVALPGACGVDLPYMAFADAIGDPVIPVTRWTSGVKWVWASADFWAARAAYRAGALTLREWLHSLRGPKVFAVHADDDLRPFLVDFSLCVRAQLARGMRKAARALMRLFSRRRAGAGSLAPP